MQFIAFFRRKIVSNGGGDWLANYHVCLAVFWAVKRRLGAERVLSLGHVRFRAVIAPLRRGVPGWQPAWERGVPGFALVPNSLRGTDRPHNRWSPITAITTNISNPTLFLPS